MPSIRRSTLLEASTNSKSYTPPCVKAAVSEADKDKEKSEYYFGNACKNRVEMMVGRDFAIEGYDQGLVNLFIYPLMEIDDKESNNFSKNFSYQNI